MLRTILHRDAQLFKPSCPIPITALSLYFAIDDVKKSTASQGECLPIGRHAGELAFPRAATRPLQYRPLAVFEQSLHIGEVVGEGGEEGSEFLVNFYTGGPAATCQFVASPW